MSDVRILERLKSLLTYTPETGFFVRNIALSARYPAGTIAGSVNALGYVQVRIDGKNYTAHRLAFLYMDGAWPEDDVDHINGVRNDNRWVNLRPAVRRVNCENRRTPRSDNISSGVLGVSKDGHPLKKPYRATIQTNGKSIRVGYFATADEAHAAYVQAKRKHHEGNTL